MTEIDRSTTREGAKMRWTLTKWWRRLRYGESCGHMIAGRWPCGIESWLNPPSNHREWDRSRLGPPRRPEQGEIAEWDNR